MLGLSNKAIALKLTVALGTVKTHVKSILRKLEAASRTEAVAIAQRRGILRDERKYSCNGTDPQPWRRDDRATADDAPIGFATPRARSFKAPLE
jgi:hypothetical protein